jgi:hypothetical protein
MYNRMTDVSFSLLMSYMRDVLANVPAKKIFKISYNDFVSRPDSRSRGVGTQPVLHRLRGSARRVGVGQPDARYGLHRTVHRVLAEAVIALAVERAESIDERNETIECRRTRAGCPLHKRGLCQNALALLDGAGCKHAQPTIACLADDKVLGVRRRSSLYSCTAAIRVVRVVRVQCLWRKPPFAPSVLSSDQHAACRGVSREDRPCGLRHLGGASLGSWIVVGMSCAAPDPGQPSARREDFLKQNLQGVTCISGSGANAAE